jgi:tRNA wybutosine-synthesizing protein 4
MDFNAKNFAYAHLKFSDLVERIKERSCLYMRALSKAAPSKAPASLEADYPAIAEDFQLGQELDLVRENHFSSVLRVSGPVNMWLHYDVS